MSTRPIVLCGPSGVGKSTLIKRLFAEYPDKFGFSVSHTTRSIRPGEQNGTSYHFVSRDEFQKLVDEGKFLEYAEFGGNLYGTTAQAVKDVSNATGTPRRAILDIDAQGVRLIKANHSSLDPVYVFIAPPTYSVLQKRLSGRGTDTDDAIDRRLRMALEELEFARQPNAFDYVIVNDDLDRAFQLLKDVVDGRDHDKFDEVPAPDEAEQARRQAMS